MEYLGNDIQRYQLSVDKYKWTNVTFMMTPEEGRSRDQNIENRFNFEKRFIDKMLVCSPVYSEFIPNVELLPLAIDLKQYQYVTYPQFTGTYRILHAPTHRGFKGTDYIIKAINDLKNDGFKIDLILAENLTHAELKEEYKKCHLFIDQIMSGWYGTATIEAMAIGRPVIVSLRDEYFKYTNFSREEIPLLHADPDNILNVLKSCLEISVTILKETGFQCRDFVEKKHDLKKLTVELLNHY
jgi:glycosyltransferase involved in cell wall biosynthesis